MFAQVRPFLKWLGKYFKAYGGWRAVLLSPLFQLATLITALNYSVWLEAKWIPLAESIIPSLLGFSLGTYAILFSLINVRLKGALQGSKNLSGVTRLEEVNATFFHFIFVQVCALICAFLFSGSWAFDFFQAISPYYPQAQTMFLYVRAAGSFLGYLLLIYSFLLIVGASMVVYRLALIRDPADGPAASSNENNPADRRQGR
ncbi:MULTISPECIES: hypothetical protein [unclassified Mesorhizobium]|uniref:hypothetical protein n=1 Tax=unclassified Mesorhizobium TaxID=325217 RepID=UPI003014AF0A